MPLSICFGIRALHRFVNQNGFSFSQRNLRGKKRGRASGMGDANTYVRAQRHGRAMAKYCAPIPADERLDEVRRPVAAREPDDVSSNELAFAVLDDLITDLEYRPLVPFEASDEHCKRAVPIES